MLLDAYEGLGLHCDAHTQLVVTCEVCRRPATKECWTCGMQICEFCTLKRHWKVRACLGISEPLTSAKWGFSLDVAASCPRVLYLCYPVEM